jgi:UDP-2,4-diacetamido-2,4,6-trideoxy-beta-L-altropyranose hydrolase
MSTGLYLPGADNRARRLSPKVNILFRTDASVEIGSGHVMRCLTLASALGDAGVACTFVCRAHTGHLAQRIEAAGHKVHLLPVRKGVVDQNTLIQNAHASWIGCSWQEDAKETCEVLGDAVFDWLVVDHYGIDARWETFLRVRARHVMVIDDLADRAHNCDLLLDQNVGRQLGDYEGLVPDCCTCLLGPKFCLLRKEFTLLRLRAMSRRQERVIRRILVSMGGVDKNNATGRVLATLSRVRIPGDIAVTVIMGGSSPWLAHIKEQSARATFPCEVKVDIDDMAVVMADSDLAIGAGGNGVYERLYMRLPSLVTPIADNQITHLDRMARAGMIWLFKEASELEAMLASILKSGAETPPDVVKNGVLSVTHALSMGGALLLPPSALDVRRTWYWLQDAQLRKSFMLRAVPDRSMHFRYWRCLLEDREQSVFAAYKGGLHIGNAGIRNVQGECGEIWLYLGKAQDRNQGNGSAILSALESIMRHRLGLTRAVLHVSAANESARRFYARSGYVETGTASHELGFNEQAIKMEKRL